jgi:hypothetical protein
MTELSIAQKLDVVLNVIKENEPKTKIVKRGMIALPETTGGITTPYKLSIDETIQKAGVIETDLIKLLAHLVSDKHIELEMTHPATHSYYKTTIIGELFIGYEKTEILQDKNFKIAQNNASEARIYANRLLWATWCAGIAAVLLLLWQAWIWFYPVHANYPYWIWETIPKK